METKTKQNKTKNKNKNKKWYLVSGGYLLQRFSRAGPRGRGRGREWATLGVHPLSWLLSNNRLEEVCSTLTKGTFSSRLLLSNQDKGCTPSVAHSLPLPLGPALLNLSSVKVGTGMCGPDRVPFRPLRFTNVPFYYLKIGLDIGRVFAKYLIFDEFFLWFTIGCQKVFMHPMVKSTDWFKIGALQETNGLDIGCKFSSSLV